MKTLKALSIMLFVGAIAAGPLTFSIACLIGNVEIFGLAGMSYLWLMLPFSVIPIASIIIGLVLHRKGLKAAKNIVAGSIMTCLMIAIGTYSFSIAPDRSGAFLDEVRSRTGLIIPYKCESASYGFYDGRVGNALISDPDEKRSFEESINHDDRWLHELTPASKGVLPPVFLSTIGNCDWYSLFVEPMGMFNPKEFVTGEYSVTLVAYQISKSHIYVFDSYWVNVLAENSQDSARR